MNVASPDRFTTRAAVHPAAEQAHSHARHIASTLQLVQEHLPMQRRILHAGNSVYRAGEPFTSLHIVHSGIVKVVNLALDGREQVVALHFKGDWLGFDGIACGCHGCEAIALDVGEIWTIRYDTLLSACAAHPALLRLLHSAMSQEIGHDRDWLMSLCTLPADARVAEFVRYWVESLEHRGLRTDQITLRMTRAEIGSYLGLTLESVSRGLSRMARADVIRFAEKTHRDVQIPDVEALADYVQRSLMPDTELLQ